MSGGNLDGIRGGAVITGVGGDPISRRRLAEMGIRPGTKVKVLYRTSGGGRVIAVDGARVALDSRLSRVIEAEADDD